MGPPKMCCRTHLGSGPWTAGRFVAISRFAKQAGPRWGDPKFRTGSPQRRDPMMPDARLSHLAVLEVSDRRRSMPTSARKRSDSWCAGLWAPRPISWAWLRLRPEIGDFRPDPLEFSGPL